MIRRCFSAYVQFTHLKQSAAESLDNRWLTSVSTTSCSSFNKLKNFYPPMTKAAASVLRLFYLIDPALVIRGTKNTLVIPLKVKNLSSTHFFIELIMPTFQVVAGFDIYIMLTGYDLRYREDNGGFRFFIVSTEGFQLKFTNFPMYRLTEVSAPVSAYSDSNQNHRAAVLIIKVRKIKPYVPMSLHVQKQHTVDTSCKNINGKKLLIPFWYNLECTIHAAGYDDCLLFSVKNTHLGDFLEIWESV
ncbi:hypothetical protein T4B_4024 [Trichinella pseudospiralis]|uniref:Uncharacterized protein n=2 Tax=Trichinella pseudospiralis TaxID=6337 RepID=A0A0V1FHB2_TRIPS|nr:hypothetical protein T4D_9192 [Trichinella pseudospiralis]KRZ33282.1 hypothetical protein T4B_4024 [Trichinella pseudospiralis]